jgi:hypothetical protein
MYGPYCPDALRGTVASFLFGASFKLLGKHLS